MDRRIQQTLVWLPRILGLFGVFFLGIFAFDVFDRDGSTWDIVGAFLLHLIPSALVLLAVALGWRWPVVGGAFFLALAVLYIVLFRGPAGSWFALVAVPMLLVGILFLTGWMTQNRVQLQ